MSDIISATLNKGSPLTSTVTPGPSTVTMHVPGPVHLCPMQMVNHLSLLEMLLRQSLYL